MSESRSLCGAFIEVVDKSLGRVFLREEIKAGEEIRPLVAIN